MRRAPEVRAGDVGPPPQAEAARRRGVAEVRETLEERERLDRVQVAEDAVGAQAIVGGDADRAEGVVMTNHRGFTELCSIDAPGACFSGRAARDSSPSPSPPRRRQ